MDKNGKITPQVAEMVIEKSKSTTYRYLTMLSAGQCLAQEGKGNLPVWPVCSETENSGKSSAIKLWKEKFYTLVRNCPLKYRKYQFRLLGKIIQKKTGFHVQLSTGRSSL